MNKSVEKFCPMAYTLEDIFSTFSQICRFTTKESAKELRNATIKQLLSSSALFEFEYYRFNVRNMDGYMRQQPSFISELGSCDTDMDCCIAFCKMLEGGDVMVSQDFYVGIERRIGNKNIKIESEMVCGTDAYPMLYIDTKEKLYLDSYGATRECFKFHPKMQSGENYCMEGVEYGHIPTTTKIKILEDIFGFDVTVLDNIMFVKKQLTEKLSYAGVFHGEQHLRHIFKYMNEEVVF